MGTRYDAKLNLPRVYVPHNDFMREEAILFFSALVHGEFPPKKLNDVLLKVRRQRKWLACYPPKKDEVFRLTRDTVPTRAQKVIRKIYSCVRQDDARMSDILFAAKVNIFIFRVSRR